MKKQLIKITLIMLVMIAMVINLTGIVNAAESSLDARLSATTTVLEKGKEVTVTISLANINVGEGVNTLKATVNWDKDILEFIDYERTVNDWSTTWNPTQGTLVAIHMSGLVKTDTAVAKLSFKVKDVEELEDTTITLTNIESANTEEKVIPSNVTLTLKAATAEKPGGDTNNNTNTGNTAGNTTNGNATSGNATSGNAANGNNVAKDNKVTTTTKNTSANKVIPHAGISDTIIIFSIVALVSLGMVALVQYKKYKDI